MRQMNKALALITISALCYQALALIGAMKIISISIFYFGLFIDTIVEIIGFKLMFVIEGE